MKNVKQILIVRKDLKMRKGKIGAQCAHASMGAILNLMKSKIIPNEFNHNHSKKQLILEYYIENSVLGSWLDGSFTKICVYVESEEELLALHEQAKKAGLINCLITDSGKTEFNGVPTNTVLAIGPAYDEALDPITGKLPLY